MNKLRHIFAALLLVLPLAFTGLTSMPSAKAASNETAYIRLHQLAFGFKIRHYQIYQAAMIY